MNNKNTRKRPSPLGEAEDDGKDTKTGSYMSHNGKRPAKSDNRLYFSTGGTSEHMDSKNVVFQYESSKEIQVQNDSKATATLETETDFSRDARAIQERALKKADEALEGQNMTSGDVKLYKGINSYTDYRAGLHHQQTLAAEKAGGDYGPLRASVHERVSAGFDYQPDICKDFKETGYCGYGDSCNFMHDRGDYRSGWEMDIEWDEKRNLALGGHDEDNVEHKEEDLFVGDLF